MDSTETESPKPAPVPAAISPGISPARLRQLRELIRKGEAYKFYSWFEWRTVRRVVLELDRNECQLCRAIGRYRRGELVHHVQHLGARPDLSLSITDPASGERQLVTVCKTCHELQHPESLRQHAPSAPPVTPERWD